MGATLLDSPVPEVNPIVMPHRSPLYFYVTLSGASFDTEGYARCAVGRRGAIKTMRFPRSADDALPYWKSEEISTVRHTFNADLEHLLSEISQSASPGWGAKVGVHVVDSAHRNEDRGGYWLDPPVLRLLAQLEAEFEIDVVQGDIT